MSDIAAIIFQPEGQPLLYAFIFFLLAAPSFGTISVFISLKGYNASIGTIAHAALLGLGISKYTEYYWNWAWLTPSRGMLFIALLTALILFAVESYPRIDTLLNVIWSTGMAIGILLLQTVPGGTNMHSYLWGNILVGKGSWLWELGGLNLAVLLLLLLPWRYHQLFIFDKEFAKSRGMALRIYSFIFFILISYTVIVVISAIGTLLTLGLSSIPSAIANLLAKNFKQMIAFSCIILFISSWLGLFISIKSNISPSSLIIIFLAAIYILTAALHSLWRHRQAKL